MATPAPAPSFDRIHSLPTGRRGCRLYDVDGNVYLDLLNNFTSLIHGHGHPRITAAIAAQAAKGTVYAAPVETQLALAEEITRRVPSMQRIRFTNSGTEAVMNALRVARAFTGRSKFLKMEGGYHGSYDPVEISIAPGPDGPAWPAGEPDEIGLSAGADGRSAGRPVQRPCDDTTTD